MGSADYFRQKAQQCRRLGSSILTRDDPTAIALEALAVDFDEKAAAAEAEAKAAMPLSDGKR